MVKIKNNYEKQFEELQKKAHKELSYVDLIKLIIEARKQRDEYHTLYENCKKANETLAERILRSANHLDKVQNLLRLH